MKKFSIEEIEVYLKSCNNLQEALDYLNENSINNAGQESRYNENIMWEGTIIDKENFIKWVKESKIHSDQIIAYPAIYIHNVISLNKKSKILIHEGCVGNIPNDTTHVVWQGIK